jgi:hypothetical protein
MPAKNTTVAPARPPPKRRGRTREPHNEFEFEFEPDMESMVKALLIVLGCDDEEVEACTRDYRERQKEKAVAPDEKEAA